MNSGRQTITVAGQRRPVLDRLRFGNKEYWVLERLGHGGRERFLAFDPTAGLRGELRVLLMLPASPATLQHVRVLQRLTHHNASFPTILDCHRNRREVILVQSWVRGRTLQSVLDQARCEGRGWPTPRQAFQAYRHLAHALGQLHNVALCVHGDLKPAHLVLVRQRVVLVDFGSAWTLERTTAREPGDGITACYASPEQHRGAAVVDFRSDHFSAAVIAYELLARQIPYDGLGGQAGRADRVAAFANKLVPPSRLAADPQGLPRAVWRRLDRVLLQALALDPEQRFPTRQACLDELDAIDALLKLRPRLHPVQEAILTGIDRVAAWLSRRRSGLRP